MEIRKRIVPDSRNGAPIAGAKEREYIFIKVTYNHFRDVGIRPSTRCARSFPCGSIGLFKGESL